MKSLLKSSMALALSLSLFNSAALLADDTEIYLDLFDIPDEELIPNVMLILDTSESMRYPTDSTSTRQESSAYNNSTVYDGNDNYSGGAGDDDYYYLYQFDDGYYNNFDYYTYYNRVHKDQINSNCSISGSTTFTSQKRVRYEDTSNSDNRVNMCEEGSGCNFVEGNNASADEVICSSTSGTRLYFASANYHNFLQSYYRITIMKTAVKDVLDSLYLDGESLNVGMMTFNGGQGGRVIHEFVDIMEGTNLQSLKDVADDINTDPTTPSTPLAETLWEAGRVFRGESPVYSSSTSVSSSMSGGRFISPIEYECQKSHIVLLTDGDASQDNGSDSAIKAEPVPAGSDYGASSYSCSSTSGFSSVGLSSCLDEVGDWLYYTDHATASDGPKNLDSEQNITIHTIGFALTDNDLLKATASDTDPETVDENYHEASKATDLVKAFSDILGETIEEKDTFVAPAVAVNAYNGLQHRSELYFALFQPNSSPRWTGNIKKYKIENNIIVDADGNDAIHDGGIGEQDTGYFKETALSFWTIETDWPSDGIDGAAPDGINISSGGYAYRLTSPDTRKIFTYLDDFTPNVETLSSTEVRDSNTSITAEMLGLDPSETTERTNVLNWSRGYDIEGNDADPVANNVPNYYVSDLIHNQPSVVTYQTTVTEADADGNTDRSIDFDDTVFAASNMGLFHAIDADNGDPVFSFIPQQLLPNLTTYYQDEGGFTNKAYGLDAGMAVWRHDDNGNGSIVNSVGGIDIAETNDHVYIYQGMRRGGKSLYALDVTLRQNPKLLWQINGNTDLDGDGNSNATTGFTDLGQTWSVPQRAKVKWNCVTSDDVTTCEDKHVLFFAGGYDTKHDTGPDGNVDEGNALYMVDAITGDLLWSAGRNGSSTYDLNLPDMIYSIPSNVTVADINGDGYSDFMFAVDILGQVWRIDFAKESTSEINFASDTTGGMIADLSGGDRRYYNAPDVSFVSSRGKKAYLSIAVGSGYRASPKSLAVTDRFYVVFDENPLFAPESYDYVDGSVITPSDMVSASLTNGITAPTDENGDPEKFYGWYYQMSSTTGEKVLSSSVTFDHQILFTTYIPSDGLKTCDTTDGDAGTGRYYLLSLLDGKSVLNDNGTVRNYGELQHGGIPPEPAVIFLSEDVCISEQCDGDEAEFEKQDNLIACVGTECIDDVVDLSLHKTYWRENGEQNLTPSTGL